MRLRLAALGLGVVSGFVFGWARLTDPGSFHAMLSLDSPRTYLLMGAAVAVAFVGARALRGRPALLTREPRRVERNPTDAHPRLRQRPARDRVGHLGRVPRADRQLGGGRVLAVVRAAGVLVGVRLQPWLAATLQQRPSQSASTVPSAPAADVV